jgi:preprotein translocase subunit YajC
MNTLFISLLQNQSAAGSGLSTILLMVGMFVIVYFFMIRPQNKKQKEIQKFRNALQVGQEIITIGGIHGTIKSISEEDNTVMLEVATGVKIKMEKSAIMPREQSGK